MFIAEQLKERNIAEYLLYMWQVEDILRANGLDIDKIRQTIIDPCQLDDDRRAKLTQWYEDLINMMHLEGVVEKGHLQINKNVILRLTDLHLQLLRSPKVPYYGAAYYKVLPYIVELRAKDHQHDTSELEVCFNALYGVLLLRLQKREVTEATAKAVEEIGKFISLLANYYDKDRRGELDDLLE